jgi:DNA-binding NarL/FixJ family response regulator
MTKKTVNLGSAALQPVANWTFPPATIRRTHGGQGRPELAAIEEPVRGENSPHVQAAIDAATIATMPKGHFVYDKATRETLILVGLRDGLQTAEIARRMKLTHETVRTYTAELLADLGAHTRAEAVLIALGRGRIKLRAEAAR